MNMQPTAVSRAIEDALKGGWKERFDDSRWSEIEDAKKIYRDAIFLDKAFWIALGVTRGWEDANDWETMSDDEMTGAMAATADITGMKVRAPMVLPQLGPHWWFISDSWQKKQHDFIESIQKDMSPEQFFLSLEGNEV